MMKKMLCSLLVVLGLATLVAADGPWNINVTVKNKQGIALHGVVVTVYGLIMPGGSSASVYVQNKLTNGEYKATTGSDGKCVVSVSDPSTPATKMSLMNCYLKGKLGDKLGYSDTFSPGRDKSVSKTVVIDAPLLIRPLLKPITIK
jgi:hypothetical protein